MDPSMLKVGLKIKSCPSTVGWILLIVAVIIPFASIEI
jgi:hypothetical protein